MSIFIKFNDGRYSQFDECDSIEFTYGRVIIFVNDYTLSYAIGQGYEF